MTARFHERHVQLYGYSYEGEQLCEIVNVRVTAIGLMDRPVVAPPSIARIRSAGSIRWRETGLDRWSWTQRDTRLRPERRCPSAITCRALASSRSMARQQSSPLAGRQRSIRTGICF